MSELNVPLHSRTKEECEWEGATTRNLPFLLSSFRSVLQRGCDRTIADIWSYQPRLTTLERGSADLVEKLGNEAELRSDSIRQITIRREVMSQSLLQRPASCGQASGPSFSREVSKNALSTVAETALLNTTELRSMHKSVSSTDLLGPSQRVTRRSRTHSRSRSLSRSSSARFAAAQEAMFEDND